MHRYAAYGLSIASDVALHARSEDPETRVDLEIVRHADIDAAEALASDFELNTERASLFWPRIGMFRIEAGIRISIEACRGASENDIALALAGPPLAMALSQRGRVVLHASCVQIAGVAVCLAGPSGRGKSTLAAAICRSGGSYVSDGMTAIELCANAPFAQPGLSDFKLFPDAAGELGYAPADWAPISGASSKLWCRAFAPLNAACPLALVLLVEAGLAPAVARFSASDALVSLTKNHVLADWVTARSAATLLRHCAPIAASVSVAALGRGASFEQLPRTVERVFELAAEASARLKARPDAG